MKNKPITVYLPERTMKNLENLAKKNGVSVSSLVGTAINLYSAELNYTTKPK